MKRLLPFLLLVMWGIQAVAQYDPEALEILNAMSAKFQKMESFKASIVYSMVNDDEGINEDFKGEIMVKGNKYRLKTDEQEIINDGETIWTYLPDVNEVNIDNFNSEEGDITPSSIYTMYKDGFKYIHLEDSQVNGVSCQVVDLIPENKDSQFYKIRMEISKNDNMLQRWTMFDKTNTKYIYTINDFKAGVTMAESQFVFNETEYDGVEVVDLR